MRTKCGLDQIDTNQAKAPETDTKVLVPSASANLDLTGSRAPKVDYFLVHLRIYPIPQQTLRFENLSWWKVVLSANGWSLLGQVPYIVFQNLAPASC